ncbi:putative tol protein [Metarhizium acridum CQMa 102]|uniref:Putative tol protein n=1 Tax=Metarhizium acridum (strain CQMa 102) TaxID=655827 RepID=E9EH98_METAQ|nr:putative tol protein [Metarhizium acridum CQMa 102]EFY84727.1 putative tol protein [Metarhizium acridum CQMa 102]
MDDLTITQLQYSLQLNDAPAPSKATNGNRRRSQTKALEIPRGPTQSSLNVEKSTVSARQTYVSVTPPRAISETLDRLRMVIFAESTYTLSHTQFNQHVTLLSLAFSSRNNSTMSDIDTRPPTCHSLYSITVAKSNSHYSRNGSKTAIHPMEIVVPPRAWQADPAYRFDHTQITTHSVDVLRLPRNFRDAITVTLGIGLKYLWIDSLCIVQDDKDDWNSESVEMENIYSSAYCTIAASSAKSSFHGFLTHREPRECVQLPIPGGDTLYTCPNIDDFDADVELGELNQRGWVLQGRALSRRTIFSSTQVYWQCSDGVRCETLTRPKCHMASFLADANFPKFALQYYRDGRQMSIQDLFERYSRQAFTDKPDRGGSDPRSAKPTFQSPQD